MKNKKLILTLIIVLVVLLVAAGTVAALYFTTDLFKTNDQLFAKYLFEKNNMSDVLKSDVFETQKQFKENNPYTSEGKLILEAESQGQKVELAQLDTNSQYNNNTKRSLTEATLKSNQEELIKFNYENSDDIYAIKVDKIYQYYIGIRNSELKAFAKKMGAEDEIVAQIPDSISLESFKSEQTISEEDSKYLEDTYLPIINNTITKEKYSKTTENITIGEQLYKANGYILSLSSQDIKQVVTDVLTKAKDDTTTISILENSLSSSNQNKELNVQETIQSLLDEIQNSDMEEYELKIKVYQFGGKTIRIQIDKDDEATIQLDIVNNTKEHGKLIFTIAGVELNGATSTLQLVLDRNTTDTETIYNAELSIDDDTEVYTITGNLTLGNIINDSAKNIISLEIVTDEQNTVRLSYDTNLEKARGELNIEELTGSNTVIVNNYSAEQLEQFFGIIMNRAMTVLGEVGQKLGIQ